MLVEKITQAFECKKKAFGVFLDLFKAFDTIDYKILLSKLYHCGIRDIAHGLKVTWSVVFNTLNVLKLCPQHVLV